MFQAPVAGVKMAEPRVWIKISAVGPYLLLFDYQEAFHCCLVIACINRINMISIECHRVGELCSASGTGKPEFDNRIESGQGKSCAYSL